MTAEEYEFLHAYEYPELARRYEFSEVMWADLERISATEWKNLAARGTSKAGVEKISERACIYVTGSLARYEAELTSDLDLFVMDAIKHEADRLTYVENAHLISSLDHVRSEVGFRPFSAGGKYIHTHSLHEIIDQTGSQQDDALNTFTARILLLMNSKPLLNERAYEYSWRRVLDRYWQNFDPEKPYLPIMLMNDIRRWWGVLGLNFEERNPKSIPGEDGSLLPQPEREINNLKLRYSRLIACYSVLVAFVYRSTRKGILRGEAEQILRLTPVERFLYLLSVAQDDKQTMTHRIDNVLHQYNDYLALASTPHDELVRSFTSDTFRHEQKNKAYKFHRDFFELFEATGRGKLLYEYAVL